VPYALTTRGAVRCKGVLTDGVSTVQRLCVEQRVHDATRIAASMSDNTVGSSGNLIVLYQRVSKEKPVQSSVSVQSNLLPTETPRVDLIVKAHCPGYTCGRRMSDKASAARPDALKILAKGAARLAKITGDAARNRHRQSTAR
jgi:hypothetical protein